MRENHRKRIFMRIRKINYLGPTKCSHKHFSRFLLLFLILDRISKLILQSDIAMFRDDIYRCWEAV